MIKKVVFTFFLMLPLLANASSAETYICKTNDDWFQKWYDERFIFIDTKNSYAKMGTGEKWGDKHALTSKKIAIGTKYFWSQELKVKDRNQKWIFVFSLRIQSDGKNELFMKNERNHEWKFQVDCKQQ